MSARLHSPPWCLLTLVLTSSLWLVGLVCRAESVFAETSDVVVSVMDGFDVCIFAYGQTGTGKTHTMEGDDTRPGMNFRTLEKLFHIKGERKEQSSYRSVRPSQTRKENPWQPISPFQHCLGLTLMPKHHPADAPCTSQSML